MTRTHWPGLLLFWVAATLLSGTFRPGFFDVHNTPAYPFLLRFLLEAVLIGSGPTIAAVVSWRLCGRQQRTSSLFGSWTRGAIALAVIPPAVCAAFGVPNNFGMNSHLAGGLIGAVIVLYALGEEIGWRGFMHDALGSAHAMVRPLIIGTAWWAWHLWFLQPGVTLQQMAGSYVLIVGTAFLFSAIVAVTRSWMSVAAFHALGNIAFFAGGIDMASNRRFLVAGVAFVLMLAVHHRWTQRQGLAAAAEFPAR